MLAEVDFHLVVGHDATEWTNVRVWRTVRPSSRGAGLERPLALTNRACYGAAPVPRRLGGTNPGVRGALREARAETDSVRDDANTMTEEVESLALRSAELEEQLDVVANERALLDAKRQETKSSLKNREQEIGYMQTRMTNQGRLEEFVRLELETKLPRWKSVSSEPSLSLMAGV